MLDKFTLCLGKADPNEILNYYAYQKINEVKSLHGKELGVG